MSIQAIIRKVDVKRNYNLSNIKNEGLFPWTSDIRTIRKIVQQDMSGHGVLKVAIDFEGKGMRYQIKGKSIINFLEKYGEGFLLSVKKHPRQ